MAVSCKFRQHRNEESGDIHHRNDDLIGTIVYELTETPTLEIGNKATLGTSDPLKNTDFDNFNLTIDKLGEFDTQVHKIIVSAKGKGISVEIEQRTDDYFGIQDIGYLYKMGKAREDR